MEQLFNIIIAFPDSQPALEVEDLRDCLVHIDHLTHLNSSLKHVLDAKLTPGSKMRDEEGTRLGDMSGIIHSLEDSITANSTD